MQIDKILNIRKQGEWHIDSAIGQDYFKALLLEMALIEGGVSARDIYKAKKETQKTQFYSFDNLTLQDSTLVDANGNAIQMQINSIAVFKNHGIMMADGGLCTDGIRDKANAIDAARLDTNIQGAIIHTSSGGGQSLAGQLLQNAIKDFVKVKPIVAFGDTIGSAAYRGILGVNEIILSSETAQIGSIGSMYPISKEELEKFIADNADMYASKSTQKNIEIRALATGDMSLLQKSLDKSVEFFHKEVKNSRGNISEKALAGGMFYAKEAIKLGLADSIGNMEYAMKQVKKYASQYKK